MHLSLEDQFLFMAVSYHVFSITKSVKLINSGRVNLNDLPCTHEEGSTNLSLSLQQLSPEPGSSAYSSSSTLQISEAPSPTNSLHGPDSDNEYDSMYS